MSSNKARSINPSQNTSTNWGLNIQIYEPMRDTSHSNHHSGECWEVLDREEETYRGLRNAEGGKEQGRADYKRPWRWWKQPKAREKKQLDTCELSQLLLQDQEVVPGRL